MGREIAWREIGREIGWRAVRREVLREIGWREIGREIGWEKIWREIRRRDIRPGREWREARRIWREIGPRRNWHRGRLHVQHPIPQLALPRGTVPGRGAGRVRVLPDMELEGEGVPLWSTQLRGDAAKGREGG